MDTDVNTPVTNRLRRQAGNIIVFDVKLSGGEFPNGFEDASAKEVDVHDDDEDVMFVCLFVCLVGWLFTPREPNKMFKTTLVYF